MPVVLTREETAHVIALTSGGVQLTVKPLYGPELRITECIRFRVRDIHLEIKALALRCRPLSCRSPSVAPIGAMREPPRAASTIEYGARPGEYQRTGVAQETGRARRRPAAQRPGLPSGCGSLVGRWACTRSAEACPVPTRCLHGMFSTVR